MIGALIGIAFWVVLMLWIIHKLAHSVADEPQRQDDEQTGVSSVQSDEEGDAEEGKKSDEFVCLGYDVRAAALVGRRKVLGVLSRASVNLEAVYRLEDNLALEEAEEMFMSSRKHFSWKKRGGRRRR